MSEQKSFSLTGSSKRLNFENSTFEAESKLTRSRPKLYTSYASAQAMLNTPSKRWWVIGAAVLTLVAPFLVDSQMTYLLSLAMVYAIGGIGLNLLTGYAGQVSLGHAFFMGVGAYTAAVLGGKPGSVVWGFQLDLAIVLPAAALVTALIGLLFAPLAAKVRGLYLAVLTLGLLLIGEHLFKTLTPISGGGGVGRGPAEAVLFGINLNQKFQIAGVIINKDIFLYLLCFVLLILSAIAARNIARSRHGRALQAVRDRDIAAEVIGVSLSRTKTLAFAVSAGYAGIAGALFSMVIGRIAPEQWNILLSINFLAVIFIGGLATISGSIIGAVFVVLLPKLLELVAPAIPFLTGEGGLLTLFQLEKILFGILIVVFIVIEPRGLYGLWLRIRNYFKAWPFSH
ncbi:MAG: branched-chain amino acid ABC transporter permease [Microbacteriaceae bacterium]